MGLLHLLKYKTSRIPVTILILTLAICSLMSIATEVDCTESSINLSRDKVPLPIGTTSVKCQCTAIQGEHTHTKASEEKEKISENIEVDILQEADPKSSKISKREDDGHMEDSPGLFDSEDKGSSFEAYRNIHLFGQDMIAPKTSADFLLLGTMMNPFEGPRRRKRATAQNKNVYYVYSEKFNRVLIQPPTHQFVPVSNNLENTSPSSKPESIEEFQELPNSFPHKQNDVTEPKIQSISHKTFSERHFNVDEPALADNPNSSYALNNKDIHLNQALKQAWEQYGPKSSVNKQITTRSQLPGYSDQGPYSPFQPSAWNIKDSFQTTGSEWDKKMTKVPVSVFDRDLVKPGMFSPILAKYIDFEVNNHEVSDFMRKLVFGFFVGLFIAGWIGLGVLVGIFPAHWLFLSGRKNSNASAAKRNSDNTLSEILDTVMLSLDSDWLKNLERKIKDTPDGNLITTHARCCILPDLKTSGVVDCQLIRKARANDNPFKCLSHLIYNFQFGEQPVKSSETVIEK